VLPSGRQAASWSRPDLVGRQGTELARGQRRDVSVRKFAYRDGVSAAICVTVKLPSCVVVKAVISIADNL